MDPYFRFWNLSCQDLEAFLSWHEPAMQNSDESDLFPSRFDTYIHPEIQPKVQPERQPAFKFPGAHKKLRLSHIMVTCIDWPLPTYRLT